MLGLDIFECCGSGIKKDNNVPNLLKMAGDKNWLKIGAPQATTEGEVRD